MFQDFSLTGNVFITYSVDTAEEMFPFVKFLSAQGFRPAVSPVMTPSPLILSDFPYEHSHSACLLVDRHLWWSNPKNGHHQMDGQIFEWCKSDYWVWAENESICNLWVFSKSWQWDVILQKSVLIIVVISPKYREDVEGNGDDEHGLHTKYIHNQVRTHTTVKAAVNNWGRNVCVKHRPLVANVCH